MTSVGLEHYQNVFGWRVQYYGGGAFLSLGAGMVGVTIPVPLASLVAERLRLCRVRGPILAMNHYPRRWVFLANHNEQDSADGDMPPGVELLKCPKRVPLPSEPVDLVRWVVGPLSSRQRLPTLEAILSAATSVTSTT